jgi:hypothetical protein
MRQSAPPDGLGNVEGIRHGANLCSRKPIDKMSLVLAASDLSRLADFNAGPDARSASLIAAPTTPGTAVIHASLTTRLRTGADMPPRLLKCVY